MRYRLTLIASLIPLLGGVFASEAAEKSEMPAFKEGNVILFQGDSITDMNRGCIIGTRSTTLLDELLPGDAESERGHALVAAQSEVTEGALGQKGRRLLPGGPQPWEGGTFSFTMKVSPHEQTYLTARFWGDEGDDNYLILFCEGKQVGYRHLGDIDVLALPDQEPRYNGRFYYVTTPLPSNLTEGKQRVQLEVRATGPIWGYGSTFEQYQKPMTAPSRAVYALYTHTDGCFVPPSGDRQGQAPQATLRADPGPEVMDQVKSRINSTIDRMLKTGKPLNQMELQFLAKAYFVKWSHACDQQRVVAQVIAGVDERYREWKRDPDRVWKDPSTWNPGWFGLGPAGDAVRLLAKPLATSGALEQMLEEGKSRRAAWSEMFQGSFAYLLRTRRWLTNQAMFSDVNLYLSNRAVAAIDPQHAMPEPKRSSISLRALG